MSFNLNLNVDHFATLRNARGGEEPNPAAAAILAELSGATGIVAHLRKDRRHICDADVIKIKEVITTKLNLEMSIDPEIVAFACSVKPYVSTIVPESDNEITTEGGLDVVKNLKNIKLATDKLHDAGIKVSLFVEPDVEQISASLEVSADIVELNTKYFAIAFCNDNKNEVINQINLLHTATDFAIKNNLYVAAGHSLNYINISECCRVIDIMEYNIGHSIIARSAFVGVQTAVREMIELIVKFKNYYRA